MVSESVSNLADNRQGKTVGEIGQKNPKKLLWI
jgi:hypothetical protein